MTFSLPLTYKSFEKIFFVSVYVEMYMYIYQMYIFVERSDVHICREFVCICICRNVHVHISDVHICRERCSCISRANVVTIFQDPYLQPVRVCVCVCVCVFVCVSTRHDHLLRPLPPTDRSLDVKDIIIYFMCMYIFKYICIHIFTRKREHRDPRRDEHVSNEICTYQKRPKHIGLSVPPPLTSDKYDVSLGLI